jgi:hypothetical protein
MRYCLIFALLTGTTFAADVAELEAKKAKVEAQLFALEEKKASGGEGAERFCAELEADTALEKGKRADAIRLLLKAAFMMCENEFYFGYRDLSDRTNSRARFRAKLTKLIPNYPEREKRAAQFFKESKPLSKEVEAAFAAGDKAAATAGKEKILQLWEKARAALNGEKQE